MSPSTTSDATSYLVRIELRRRWRSIAVLALLIALVVGAVLSSVAGAGRSRTAFDRYLAEVNAPAALAVGDPDALARLADHEAVRAAVPMDLPAIFPEVAGEEFYPMLSVGRALTDLGLYRFPVVEGRLPATTAPLELAVGERTAARLSLERGDRLTMLSLSPSAAAENSFEDPDGPMLVFDVVGIVRDPGDIGARLTDITLTVLSPAFREHYPPEVIGSIGGGTFITLREGRALSALSEDLRGKSVELDASFSTEAAAGSTSPTMRAIATALTIFAIVVGLAGLAAIAQATARLQQVAAQDDRTLAALGVGGRARWARVATSGAVAAAIGVPVGIALAIGASPLFPVGLARRAEPDLGVDVDASVLILGGVACFVVAGALVAGMAAWSARSLGLDDQPVRISALGRTLATGGAPPSWVSGLSLAAGTPGGPGRAAIGGTLLGVLGVLAALVFSASVERLQERPDLYGWGWDAAIEGADLSDLPTEAFDPQQLVADEDLAAVGTVTTQLAVTIDDVPDFATAIQDVKGHLSPVVVRGVAPVQPDEIALGRDTLDRVGAAVGDEVAVSVGDDPTPMRITGVVAFAVSADGGTSATGAFFSSTAAEAMGFDGYCDVGDSCSRGIAVKVQDGVDPQVVVDRYADEAAGVAVRLPVPPGEIERLTAVENLPRYLAGFLAMLAAVAVSFATATTVRRRRADLAVLRVLGMTARQLRSVVTVAVLSLTLLGAAGGGAAGLVVGRQVWRAVANSVSLPFAPTLPLAAAVLVPLAALVLAQVVATITRRAAGRIPAALVLRTE